MYILIKLKLVVHVFLIESFLQYNIIYSLTSYSYEVTSNKFTRDLFKELIVSLVASVFMGFGVLFLLLWVGIFL